MQVGFKDRRGNRGSGQIAETEIRRHAKVKVGDRWKTYHRGGLCWLQLGQMGVGWGV